MDLRQIILKEHSKANCDRIVSWIGNSQKRFDELFALFINDEYRVVQRAAWPLSYSSIKHPELICSHFGQLLKNVQRPGLPIAVKRNTVRLLHHIPIPKRFHGKVMDLCFGYIASPGEAVAVKAFSLTILQNLSRLYPDIKSELRLLIVERWDYETVAFRTRAKKILKEM